MAVPEQIPVVNYVADGIVKKFDVPFEYDQQSDLHVYVGGAEPTIDKYYFDGNAFNFYIAPTSGQDVKIKRITPKERDTDYNLHTNTVRPKALNTDFDRLWYVLQEVFSDVGGLSQTVQDEIIARIQGDEDLLNQLTAEISARMLGDESVTEDLKNYVNQVVGAIIGDPSFAGIDAKNVNDASGETQQQVNYNGGSKWHSRVGGYKLNERVVLTNGDIVKSTINGNMTDPNVDMTGWVLSGNSITVKSIAELIAIANPKDGDVVYVKGYYPATNFALAKPYLGGGLRIYVDAKKAENDGFLCINGWILQVENNTVTLEQAGAKGDLIQDDAPFIRTAIEKFSKAGGGTIQVSQKYLVNSYRAENSTDIFELWPNITFQGVGDSQFFVGSFFHDKSVIVFNNPWFLTTPLKNTIFKDIRITSNIAENHLVSGFHLRIAVHFQSAVDCGYIGGSIDNFDCQNAIISGWIDTNGWSGTVGADLSNNVTIDRVKFTNLAYGEANYDHSTCYILSKNSVVKYCTFQGSLQTQKVGCPVELHNSHTQFVHNFVIGYTRGVWLAEEEVPNITDQLVALNRFYITNDMLNITAQNGVYSNVRVFDNYCECNHPEGFLPLHAGVQGLFVSSVAGVGSEATGFEFARNTVKIKRSSNSTMASAFSMKFFVSGFSIYDNDFYGAQSFSIENTTLNAWKIVDNNFYQVTTNANAFGSITNPTDGNVSGFQFSRNHFSYEYGSAPQYTLAISNSATNIDGCDISGNTYSKNNPQTGDVLFSTNMLEIPQSNKLDIRYFKCSGSYSGASANGWGVLSITPPRQFPFGTRAEVTYNPASGRMLSGVSHYNGASVAKFPFYTESTAEVIAVTGVGVRFILNQ